MVTWDVTCRPRQNAEVTVEPDGTFEIHWRKGLTVLLSSEEARKLTGELLDAQLRNQPVPV